MFYSRRLTCQKGPSRRQSVSSLKIKLLASSKNPCYLSLFLHRSLLMSALWTTPARTAVRLSAHCGAFFNELKHAENAHFE